MNKYEAKAIGYFNNAKYQLEQHQTKESVISKEIGELMDTIDTLQNAKEKVPAVAAELDKNIQEYKIKIKHHEAYQRSLLKSIKEYHDEMRFFADNICPHEHREYDHTDYHKNEDYQKCKLCGKVF